MPAERDRPSTPDPHSPYVKPTGVLQPSFSPETAFVRAFRSRAGMRAADMMTRPFMEDEAYRSCGAFTRAAAEGLARALNEILNEAGLPADLVKVEASPEAGYLVVARRTFDARERKAYGFGPPLRAGEEEGRCVAILFCEPFAQPNELAQPLIRANEDPWKVVGLVTADASLTNLSSRTYHSGVDVVYHTALTDLMGRIRTVDADAAFAGLLRDEYVKSWTSLFEDIHL